MAASLSKCVLDSSDAHVVVACQSNAPNLCSTKLPHAYFLKQNPIHFKFFSQGELLGVPGTAGMLLDPEKKCIGVRISKMPDGSWDKKLVAKKLLHYEIGITASNTPEREFARIAWAVALILIDPNAEADGISPKTTWEKWRSVRGNMMEEAEKGHKACTKGKNESYDCSCTVRDLTGFTFRKFLILNNVDASLVTDDPAGFLPDGNKIVRVEALGCNDAIVWVDGTIYNHSGPGLIAAFAGSLLDDCAAKELVHVGCMLADLHAWKISRYCGAVYDTDSSLDFSSATERVAALKYRFPHLFVRDFPGCEHPEII